MSASLMLIMDAERAGVEIRRLARVHKLRPDTEVREALDDRLLYARYLSKRGLDTDDFAELLVDNVTNIRPSHDEVVEMLKTNLPARRRTRSEIAAEERERFATCGAAREIVDRQLAEHDQFRERVRRGTKLTPWICACTRGATLQVSYRFELAATCDTCGDPFRRKHALPSFDEHAIAVCAEDEVGIVNDDVIDTEVPF